MRITLLIAGTRGDIQPAIALGVGLKKAGHAVRLVTFAEFRQLAFEHGLDFLPIQLDMPALLERYGRSELFDSGAMVVRFLPEAIKVFQLMFEQMTRHEPQPLKRRGLFLASSGRNHRLHDGSPGRNVYCRIVVGEISEPTPDTLET